MSQNVRVLSGEKFSIRVEFDAPEGTSLRYLKTRFLDPLLQPNAEVAGSVYVKPKQGRTTAILVLCEANRALMTEEMVLRVRNHVEQNVLAHQKLIVQLEAIGWPVDAPGGWAGISWGLLGVGLVAGYALVRVLMDPKHAKTPAAEREVSDRSFEPEEEERRYRPGGGGYASPQYTRRRAPPRQARLFEQPQGRSRRARDIDDINRSIRP